MKDDTLVLRATEKRNNLFGNDDTNCFRLFNSEGDGIKGLTIDIYGEYLLVQFFSDKLQEDILRNAIVNAADRIPVQVKGIFLKNRTRLNGHHNYPDARKSIVIDGSVPPEGYTVMQNGIKAHVDLIHGQSTGIFLDMREIRAELVQYYPPGGTILNLFSYTGLFSVHALKNGMKRSLNVDLSKTVLKRAQKNYIANVLSCDERDFLYGDTMQWLRRFSKMKQSFSFAVFDPPTFSRNKKKSFSVKSDYVRAMLYLDTVCSGGYIFTAVNSFSISKEEYCSFHPSSWDLVMYKNESVDFYSPGRAYLKAGLWKCRERFE